MSNDLIFVGYRCGKSKKGSDFYILNFITSPNISKDGSSAYTTNVDIFTDKDKFNSFIKETELLSMSTIPCEIVGDKVRYYL